MKAFALHMTNHRNERDEHNLSSDSTHPRSCGNIDKPGGRGCVRCFTALLR